jgi:hypothetical protein
MTTHTALLAFFLAAASLAAQTVDPADRVQRLDAAFGSGWTVHWNEATGSPAAVYGPGLRIAAGPLDREADARAAAGVVLDRLVAAVGVGESRFEEVIAARATRVWVFVYRQLYRGLPVIGGRADVRIHHRVGVASMFGTVAVPIPAGFGVRPSITSEFAAARALEALGLTVDAGEQPAEPRLVVWADPTGARLAGPALAYEVKVDRFEAGTAGRAYIDAHTAALLRYENDILSCQPRLAAGSGVEHECGHDHDHDDAHGRVAELEPTPLPMLQGNVKGNVTVGPDPLGAVSLENLENIRVRVAGDPAVYRTDAMGNFNIPFTGTSAQVTVNLNNGLRVGSVMPANGTPITQTLTVTPGVSAQFTLLTPNPNQFDRAQLDAYYHADKVNEWVRTILQPAPAGLATVDAIGLTVNDQTGACNAYYTNNRCVFYASGSIGTYVCNNMSISDVIYHEWGHGLDDAFGGILSNNTTEGLSEGWADLISCYLNDRASLGNHIGSGLSRSAINNIRYPAVGCAFPDPHCAGQTLSGFAWQLRERLAQSLGRPQAIAHSNDIVIPAITANPDTQPRTLIEVFLLDDDDGNLRNGTPHYVELEGAAQHHGIPYPQRDHASVTHTPLGNFDRRLTPRIVRSQVVARVGTITSVEVHYTTPAGTSLRVGVPSGAPNEFISLLPGVGQNEQVSYYFLVRVSTGQNVRHPSVGDFTYVVSQPTTLTLQYRLIPEQASIGASMTFDLVGTPNAALGLVIGDTPGPIQVPGLPPFLVGGNLIAITASLDAQGRFLVPVPVPNDPGLVGALLYTQALTLDSASRVRVSNPTIALFQP